MAIYSCSISNSRKNGVKNVSAKEHHEYISRIGNYSPNIEEEKFQSATSHLEYIQRQENYQHREEYEDLVCSENKNMPFWAEKNPNLFWIASEEFERANGRTYSEFLLSLPCELSDNENKELVNTFCQEMFGESFVFSYGIHSKKSNTEGIQNIHAHIMFCERKLDGIQREDEQFFKRYNPNYPERGGAKKDRFWNDQKMFKYTRKTWEEVLNKKLEEKDLEKVSASSLKIQRMEAKLAGDTLKEEFLNRPPVNCPGKILMKLEKYGIEALSKKEKEQYDSYLLAKELRDMAKEVYTLSRELEKEQKEVETIELEEKEETIISSPFVVESKKEEIMLESSKERKEKIKEFTEQFSRVIEDRVRYAVLTEKQEEENNRMVNTYEQEKWRSQYLGAGLGTLLLEEQGNIYQRQLKEMLLERTKKSKFLSTIEETPSFQEDYSSLKHEEFEFLPSPELYKAQRKKVEKELKEITLEKEKRLQEHREWHFKNYSLVYLSLIESALKKNPDFSESEKKELTSCYVEIKKLKKKEESLEEKKKKGTLVRFFNKFEEKSLEKERRDCFDRFSTTIKEYQKDPEFYKMYNTLLLEYSNFDQEFDKNTERNVIGEKFVEEIRELNVKQEMKQLEIEYLSYLESHGLLDEKVVKTGIEEKEELVVASLEREQEKVIQEKEMKEKAAIEQKEREEAEKKAVIEQKAKEEAERKAAEEQAVEDKANRLEKMWERLVVPIEDIKETPTISILRSVDKFDHEVLNNYLNAAFAYGESQFRLESAENALKNPERFKNKPQVLENYKKLKKEYLANYLANVESLEKLKAPLEKELCYYSNEDITLIYRKKYEELLKEQRRVSSILDNKKARGDNVTEEFATLKGIGWQKSKLDLAFMGIINIVKVQDEFSHLRTKTKKQDEKGIVKDSPSMKKEENRVEKESSSIEANITKKLPKGVQKGKEDTSNVGRTRTKTKEQDSKIAKRGQKQEETSNVKGNYIAPVIPKKKKKKWKDLVNDDDRDF